MEQDIENPTDDSFNSGVVTGLIKTFPLLYDYFSINPRAGMDYMSFLLQSFSKIQDPAVSKDVSGICEMYLESNLVDKIVPINGSYLSTLYWSYISMVNEAVDNGQ